MVWATEVAAVDSAAVASFGIEVTYAGNPLTIILDRNVIELGEFGQVVERTTQVTVRKSDAELSEGDTLTNGGETLTVIRLESDDGGLARWTVNTSGDP